MTPDFDDLIAKAEAFQAAVSVDDLMRTIIQFHDAASPDVIRALVLRLREADRLLDTAPAALEASRRHGKAIARNDVEQAELAESDAYAWACDVAAYFDTTEGGE